MGLLGHVDTIKELTDILTLDETGLRDVGGVLRHLGEIDAAELDLVLDIGRTDVLDALRESHATHALLTEEVTDLHRVVLERHVDGEMGVHETHLVLVADTNTRDQVLDQRADSAHAGELLAVAEPQVDAQLLLVDAAHVERQVTEVTEERAALAGDGDLAAVKDELDILRDLDVTGG